MSYKRTPTAIQVLYEVDPVAARDEVIDALRGRSIKRAAHLLCISRPTLYRLFDRLNLGPCDRRRAMDRLEPDWIGATKRALVETIGQPSVTSANGGGTT